MGWNDGWNLGKLTEALKRNDAGDKLCFDFGDLVPSGLHSYRGFYEDLAIGYDTAARVAVPTVGEWLKLLEVANGKTFEGYKGGQYMMRPETTLWVSDYDLCSDTTIVGIHEDEHAGVTLLTGHCPH